MSARPLPRPAATTAWLPLRGPARPSSRRGGDQLRRRLLLSLCIIGSLGAPQLLQAPTRASGIGEIVKALCLSAIETELSRAGKVPPPGMAAYACSCVERQISAGRGIETARNHCRELTAQRFPI